MKNRQMVKVQIHELNVSHDSYGLTKRDSMFFYWQCDMVYATNPTTMWFMQMHNKKRERDRYRERFQEEQENGQV